MVQNACTVYDFTDNKFTDLEKVKEWCKKYCKKWVFQGEKVSREHWQGRISLKIKKRLNEIPNPLKFHFSVTSNANKANDFYVMKEDSRITPIYSSEDEEIYIPRQIRGIELRDWQESIINTLDVWDTRTINVLIDKKGNIGKSTLICYIRSHKLGRVLPMVNDYKDVMRMVCNLPTSRAYLFDLPRAINKERLFGFFSGIEDVKNGYAWDDRYSFKEKVFDCPNIWIFSNMDFDTSLVSSDRWKVWYVEDDKLCEA